jgi:exonuclease III
MNLKIVTWNVRGLNDREKRLQIKNLIKMWKADVICLQETKLELVSRSLVKSLWGCHYVDWAVIGSVGASGGILVMWDRRVVEKVEEAIGQYSVSCKFQNVEDQFEWAFSGVYGPNTDSDRHFMWDELSGVCSWWGVPWCVAGDFNVVRFPSERSGSVGLSTAMMGFSDFITEMGLLDIPLQGGRFTWSNNRAHMSSSRIDRFLISADWDGHFPKISQKRLPRVLSDHFPVLLDCGFFQGGAKPFRFENMWLKADGFVEKVKGWWESYQVQGTPSFIFAYKLKALKGDLKKWNAEEFGNVETRLNSLWSELRVLDSLAEERQLTIEERDQHSLTQAEIEKTILMVETCWRQKSRALWLKEGDRNTKFFHRVANSHKRNNSIMNLRVNGILTEDKEEIKGCITQFYQHLFCEPYEYRPHLDGLGFSRISEDNSTWLDRPFEEEEVMGVVMGCVGDKSPGPDGFPMAFFQYCWHIIKADLMAVFQNFHSNGEFERSLNATFLVLIPKKFDAEEVKDFRPISLVGGVYKIISKVLAHRLRVVLPDIISETQNAFIGGRQILDSALIASECIDSRLKSGSPGVLCKLDVEKAYDHVSWTFLQYLLDRCGFSESWQRWIYSCISTTRFSVMINGSPEGFFAGSRGLRQGDPLSPMLFDIVMEALSRMLDRAVQSGLFKGFSVGSSDRSQIEISHLLFADDTLIFCDADPHQLTSLRFVFTWFEAVSGLKINLGKSELVPVGEVSNMGLLVDILGCNLGSFPMKYLGVPLGAAFKEKAIWNPVLEKVERRLAGWKRLYLSKGGRVTLIKSTLSSIPTYLLSLFPLPVSVAHRLEKLQRDFLWGGIGEEKRFHLIRWDKVCLPLQNGGLAIKNLRLFNQALLGKWIWRFGNEREFLWRKVIEAKYGTVMGGWCSSPVNSPHGVSLWKTISKDWSSFKRFISFEVGDGSRVSFWHDVWCGDSTLKESFPTLFAIACNPTALVADILQVNNGTPHWDLTFTRYIQDWESEALMQLIEILYAKAGLGSGIDAIRWGAAKSKCFTVGSYYRALSGTYHGSFPWKMIWKSRAPPRVAFFVWTVTLGRILTIDNLRRRNVMVLDWCCMCKKGAESVEHLLLHCPFVGEVWSMVFGLFGVVWVMPRTILELLECWQGCFGKHRNILIWRVIPHCLMWCIWRERNGRSFENCERSYVEIKYFFLRSLYDWVAGWGIHSCISFQEFLELCSLRSP